MSTKKKEINWEKRLADYNLTHKNKIDDEMKYIKYSLIKHGFRGFSGILKVHETVLRRELSKLGIKLKTKGILWDFIAEKYGYEGRVKDFILTLLKAHSFSCKKASKRIGVSDAALVAKAKSLGIKLRGPGGQLPFEEPVVRVLRELPKEEYTNKTGPEIAKELGISVTWFYRIAKLEKFPYRRTKGLPAK